MVIGNMATRLIVFLAERRINLYRNGHSGKWFIAGSYQILNKPTTPMGEFDENGATGKSISFGDWNIVCNPTYQLKAGILVSAHDFGEIYQMGTDATNRMHAFDAWVLPEDPLPTSAPPKGYDFMAWLKMANTYVQWKLREVQ